jgi:multidrug resistance efflux pump
MAMRSVSRRTVALLGLGGLLSYVVWIGWPYFHAIVVRDAAVTSWLGVTTAPIAGYATNVLHPGDRTGADGRIATIADSHADSAESARTQAELARARARVAAEAAIVEAAQSALEVRAVHATEFAATFSRDLDAAVAGASKSVAALQQHLALDRDEAARIAALNQVGVMSQSQVDAANANVAESERQIAETQATLDRTNARLRAAANGVFLLADGTDGNSAIQNLADARLRLLQAREALTQLRAEQDAAQLAYDKTRSLDILVPPDAMVWSLISSPGAPVLPGSPIASWVDCRVMLVDAPVSDVEAALLHPGSIAHVVIEGERTVRTGSVMLTRGSAGTLDSHDLAAIAKGRHSGVAQALVKLVPSPDDIKACAVGHAAYVDFPEVGIFDLFRARLRLGPGSR